MGQRAGSLTICLTRSLTNQLGSAQFSAARFCCVSPRIRPDRHPFNSPKAVGDVPFRPPRTAGRQLQSAPGHPIANTFDRYVATRAGPKLSPAANLLWREIVRLMSSVQPATNNRRSLLSSPAAGRIDEPLSPPVYARRCGWRARRSHALQGFAPPGSRPAWSANPPAETLKMSGVSSWRRSSFIWLVLKKRARSDTGRRNARRSPTHSSAENSIHGQRVPETRHEPK
jgi:hypothetical protein